MTTTDAWLILLLVLALWLTLTRCLLACHPAPPATQLPGSRRPFRPQTLAACPLCRQASVNAATETAPASPPPWRQRKSRRGAPKRVATDGYACTNPACLYGGITDAAVHALVADGHHGRDRIQDFCRIRERSDPPAGRVRN